MCVRLSTNCCNFFTDRCGETVYGVPLTAQIGDETSSEVRLEIVESACNDSGEPLNVPSSCLRLPEVVVLTPESRITSVLLPLIRTPHNGYVAIRIRHLLPWGPAIVHSSYSNDGDNPCLLGGWWIYRIDAAQRCPSGTQRSRSKPRMEISNIVLEKLKID